MKNKEAEFFVVLMFVSLCFSGLTFFFVCFQAPFSLTVIVATFSFLVTAAFTILIFASAIKDMIRLAASRKAMSKEAAFDEMISEFERNKNTDKWIN